MAMKKTAETPMAAIKQARETTTTGAAKSGFDQFDQSADILQDHAAETTKAATEQVSETMTTATAAVKSGFDQSVGALQNHAAGAMAGFEKTQTEVKANMDKVMKSAEDMVSFGQGNVEAIVKSSQIWAAGVQDLSKAFAATAQAQMDAAMSAMKALSSVKSLKDAVELHTTATRSSVETVMAETGKLTDASMKLAEQAMAPIAARVTLAAEKFGRAA